MNNNNNNNNNNNVNNQVYNRDRYIEAFGRLHHRDGPAPYANYNIDAAYYYTFMNQFMDDMRQLANIDRQEFERILTIVSNRIRGPSDIKTRMIELNISLPPRPQQGGRRSLKKSQRRLKKQSGSRKKQSGSRMKKMWN